jgi:hypothetical protein
MATVMDRTTANGYEVRALLAPSGASEPYFYSVRRAGGSEHLAWGAWYASAADALKAGVERAAAMPPLGEVAGEPRYVSGLSAEDDPDERPAPSQVASEERFVPAEPIGLAALLHEAARTGEHPLQVLARQHRRIAEIYPEEVARWAAHSRPTLPATPATG